MFTTVSLYTARSGKYGEQAAAAARHKHSVLAAQPGFVGRLVGRNYDDANEYVEAVQWESSADADAAEAVVSAHRDGRAWAECIDASSAKSWGMKTVGVISRRERSFDDAAVGVWLMVRWRTRDDVRLVEHTRNELLMHHEAFAPVSGYLGAVVLQETRGQERMELIAWPTVEVARSRVAQILSSGDALVEQHLADCAEGSSIHYLAPILRG